MIRAKMHPVERVLVGLFWAAGTAAGGCLIPAMLDTGTSTFPPWLYALGAVLAQGLTFDALFLALTGRTDLG